MNKLELFVKLNFYQVLYTNKNHDLFLFKCMNKHSTQWLTQKLKIKLKLKAEQPKNSTQKGFSKEFNQNISQEKGNY